MMYLEIVVCLRYIICRKISRIIRWNTRYIAGFFMLLKETLCSKQKELLSSSFSWLKKIPRGIPINNDLKQVIILSKNIILFYSLLVIPTLFNIANSLLRRNTLVVIVLNILVIPISAITVINPYKNIATKVYKDWTSLFSLSKLLIV